MNYFETNSGTNLNNTGREKGHGQPMRLPCDDIWGALQIVFSAKMIDQYVNYFETNSGTNQSNTGQEKGHGKHRGLSYKNLWGAHQKIIFGQINRLICELL